MLERGIHAHITFITGAGPLKKAHWLDRRVLRFGVFFNIWIHLFVLQNFEKDTKQGQKGLLLRLVAHHPRIVCCRTTP
jgi:hypothetical protein